MAYDLVSLSIIMMIAVTCPIITQLIPGKPMPQTVLLLVFGDIRTIHPGQIWVTKPLNYSANWVWRSCSSLMWCWARSRPASSCDSSRRTATIH